MKRNQTSKLPFANFAIFGELLSLSRKLLRDSNRAQIIMNEIARLHAECRATECPEVWDRNNAKVGKLLAELKKIGP